MRKITYFKIWFVLAVCVLGANVRAESPGYKLFRGGVSDRDLLKLNQPGFSGPGLTAQTPTKASPDTLRILAIRVAFQEDSNPLTTGNGRFDLSDTTDVTIDPPPHNLDYFNQQLLALRNYFKSVSRGQLILEFEVFPGAADASYTVAQQMSSYVPVGSDQQLDRRLSELFQEAFQLADATDDINFSKFDSFILFHAGVGSDFALDFDDTPQDIPSVFLDFETLKANLANSGSDFQGIAVNNGTFFIKDGLILPETQDQQGFEIGLLGTMAIMFGHQLGLPNLFNTDNGLPGIGVFGLMDQGSGNFSGLLPAEPCAWSKVFLGWETPTVIANGADLPVAASKASNTNKIYKIPINSEEYFLVENRERDIGHDNLATGRLADGSRVEFRSDEQGQRILFEGQRGVITQVNEYDFGLPGSGILIWHIDESVITATLKENRVNANPDRRGVDLEEADGAQDIGQVYDFLHPAAGQENGTVFDMWWQTNDINQLVNDSSQVVAFTPTSRPNSRSNDGANSNIYLDHFSEPDSVMTFSVRSDLAQAGFPQFVGSPGVLSTAPILADLNNDGSGEIVLTSNENTDIYVWKSDGAKFIANADSAEITNVNGTITRTPLALFATPPGAFAFSPALAAFDNREVVVAVTDQVVAAYLPQDTDADGRADDLFIHAGGSEFTTAPLILETDPSEIRIAVGTLDGRIVVVDEKGDDVFVQNVSGRPVTGLARLPQNRIAFATRDGNIGLLAGDGNIIADSETNTSFSKAPLVGDLDSDGNLNLIFFSDEGQLFVLETNGENTAGFPVQVRNPWSQVVMADIDKDGFNELLFLAENSLFALNRIGALKNGFPVQISKNAPDEMAILPAPILADLDGDGRVEIVAGSRDNQLMAFHSTGQPVMDFPFSAGGAIYSTPTIGDMDNDADMEIVAAADDGFIYVWDLPNSLTPGQILWGSYLHDPQHSNANLKLLQPEAPSGELMPHSLVYNYPNPTVGNQTTIRYTLNFPAEVRIKIFDLAGDLVDEFRGPGVAQAENEVNWALNAIESGVYLAQVEAQGTDKKEVAIFKIAVVK